MSFFHGKQGKGAQRVRKAELREQAEARNAETLHGNTKAHRLGRCNCQEG